MWASLFPAMELATGILFPVIIRSYGFNVFGVTNLVIGFLFIVIAGSDSLCRLIPNKALALIAALSLLLSAIRGITQGPHVLIWALLGGAVGFLLLYPVALFRPGELGIGDIKTAGAMGLYLGAGKILPALALSFILAALWVLPLLVLGYKRKNDQIPLGVFLAAGALLVAVSA